MENNNIEAYARLNHHRGSAQKARLILDQIRGKKVAEAKNILQFSNKKMAKDIHKLLDSAVANATQVAGKIDTDTLVVTKAFADGATHMKRIMPSFKGSANRILKKTCHITISIGNK